MIGRTISHYEILERIGGGGMGEVFKARDTRLDRFVALKFLAGGTDDDREAGERFLREARAASALDHPNICVVHDVGRTDDGRLWLCMAYYEGETLASRLAEGPVSEAEAVRVAVQVCRGLARAHTAGIVHRDIKPANVMLTRRNEVKLVDFGLARRSGEARLTSAGMTAGTAAYMSPEQVRGAEVDHRTDLWSLGVLLYEMLTGRLPFAGDNLLTIARTITEEAPDPPSRLREGLSAGMDGIVARLLAKSPEERYASADEAAADLLAGQASAHDSGVATAMFATGAEGPVSPETVDQRPPAGSRTSRRAAGWHWWAAALGVAVVAAAAVWHLASPRAAGGTSGDFKHLAVVPFANYTGSADLDHLADGLAAGLISSLAEIGDLQVVGRAEAWSHRDENLTASELGERLGVDLLVEGSIQGSPEALVVNQNLLEVRSGGILTSYQVTGSAEDLLGLQRGVDRGLIEVLEISLSPRERRRLAIDPTHSFQAYEEYLRGVRRLEGARDPADLEAAAALFREAIRRDPEFALAHVGLSEALWWRSRREGDRETLEAAGRAVDRALELDAELPAALVATARIDRSSGRYGESIAGLEKILERHPNPDEAYREIAGAYEQVGDLAAAESSLRSAAAVAGDDWFNWNSLGAFLWRKGDYAEARTAFERAAGLAPSEVAKPRGNLAALELSQGRVEAALEAYESIARPIRSVRLASNIGTAYYFSDRPDKWRKAEEHYRLALALSPRDDQVVRNLADLYLQTGEVERARELYRQALEIVGDRLEADPASHELRLRAAFYAAKAGACDEALPAAAELAGELPPAAQSTHRLAYVWALCDERGRALEAIRQAIEQGASRELIAREDEFARMRDDPAFRELVGEPR